MALHFLGEWDGVCACGKREADGIRCVFGAAHRVPVESFPWVNSAPKAETELPEKMPWE